MSPWKFGRCRPDVPRLSACSWTRSEASCCFCVFPQPRQGCAFSLCCRRHAGRVAVGVTAKGFLPVSSSLWGPSQLCLASQRSWGRMKQLGVLTLLNNQFVCERLTCDFEPGRWWESSRRYLLMTSVPAAYYQSFVLSRFSYTVCRSQLSFIVVHIS